MSFGKLGIPTTIALFLDAALAAVAIPESAHPVVLENDYVRVTEAFADPGQEITIDGPLPRVIISASRSRFADISRESDRPVIDYNRGQILWRDAAAPRTVRLVAGSAQLFVIELKRAAAPSGISASSLEPDHSTIVDPDQHHQILENAHVRIIDGMAPTGARSAAHSHPPSVLVSLTKSRFRVTIEGKTRIFDFEPGMVRWTNHFRHQWQILAGEARVVMVEIKAAHADPRFRRVAGSAPKLTDFVGRKSISCQQSSEAYQQSDNNWPGPQEEQVERHGTIL